MQPKFVVALLIVLLGWSSFAWGGQIRIDGSSDDAANRSFQRMMSSLKPDKQQQLAVAFIQINMTGVNSVYEALNDPGLQHPSAARIKDKIAGMTASEIIEFARKTATAQVFIKGQEPGVPADLTRPLVGGTPTRALADSVWVIDENINGHVKRDVYELHSDHTMTLIESDKKPSGVSRWEQAGDEVRLSINDGYTVMLGRFADAITLKGEGGSKAGFRMSWAAAKR
jgi:hypothetical protein